MNFIKAKKRKGEKEGNVPRPEKREALQLKRKTHRGKRKKRPRNRTYDVGKGEKKEGEERGSLPFGVRRKLISKRPQKGRHAPLQCQKKRRRKERSRFRERESIFDHSLCWEGEEALNVRVRSKTTRKKGGEEKREGPSSQGF